MPELPEVQTTVNGINAELKGLKILDVWTDYNSPHHAGKNNIKNPTYFKTFKKAITGSTIKQASRRGKNVLIHLDNGKTILIHMKMTGHLIYGEYKLIKNSNNKPEWVPIQETGPLKDPFNKFIHTLFTLERKNKKVSHLAFSDMRKFAKVSLAETKELDSHPDFKSLGLEPLSPDFTYKHFKEQLLKKSKSKIKQVLMNQSLVTGIGNIYSDEILWEAGIHPDSLPSKIPEKDFKNMFKATLANLKQGINFGGDSMSDYRNIYGERGEFQHKHRAYRKTGKACEKKGCTGTILRKKMGGRSAHYCSVHQKLYS